MGKDHRDSDVFQAIGLESEKSSKISLKNEASLFLNLAGPSVLIQICMFWMWVLNSMYVGKHIGSSALAAMSLGNLTGNLTGLSLIFGVLSANDTLGPQAAGAGKWSEVAILSARGVITCWAIMPLCFLVWFKSEDILLVLDQPVEVSKLASEFLRSYCWTMPFMVTLEVFRKILGCQNIVRPFIWITFVSTFLLHPLFLDYFIAACGFGIRGAAYALLCTYLVMNMLTLLHMRYNRPKSQTKLWKFLFDGVHHPDSVPTFYTSLSEVLEPTKTKQFLYLGFFGIISNTEWWYWEAIAFIAGQCGPVQLAAHAIGYNVLPLCFMIPLGISIGVTTRVGTLLGSDKKETAIAVSKWSMVLYWSMGISTAIGVYLCEERIVDSFTEDSEVKAFVSKIWPFVAAFSVMDGTFGLLRGVLLGLGQQFNMSVVTILILWLVGLPFTIYYVFTLGKGVVGLWHILPVTYFIFAVALGILTCIVPWKKLEDAK